MSNIDKSKSKEIREDLYERFLGGDKLSIQGVVDEYFNPKNPYNYLVVQNKARNWMTSIKKKFEKDGLWFGNLDPDGNYGLITTVEEATYAMIRYYKFVKGNISKASLLAKDAKSKNILPEGIKQERMLLARVEEQDEEENGD